MILASHKKRKIISSGMISKNGAVEMAVIPYKAYPKIITSDWGRLASWAYDQYLVKGRGAIYIQKNVSSRWGGMKENFRYVPYNRRGKDIEPRIGEIIDDYDPEKEIVVQFIHLDSGIRTIRVSAANRLSQPDRIWFRRFLPPA